ncbi:hypothetical protein [Pseudonocardia sp. 73-21]
MVAGQPVPRGWYSQPWWRPALLFSTMPGVADAYADGGGFGD